MNFKVYILSFILLIIIGCASEPSRIDIKGDSISILKDSSSGGQQTSSTIDEKDQDDQNDMWRILEEYGQSIRKYSKRYGFDWRLILAIIKKESRFSLVAESHKGAFGLMQIMPETGKSLAEELNLEEVISPRNNIAAGVYYLWKLQENFESADEDNRLKLSLAAYNCGLGRVMDAREIARARNQNPNDWNNISEALKLLSRENSDLHKNIWSSDKPPSGYFSDFSQPLTYVEQVLKYYNNYKIKFAYN